MSRGRDRRSADARRIDNPRIIVHTGPHSGPCRDNGTPTTRRPIPGWACPIRHCDELEYTAGGGRNPECAIATEMQLPTGPVGSIRTAEPVATPSLLW